MLTAPETRLGRNSSDEVKAHPFFAGVDWNTIRNIEPPFVPHLKYALLSCIQRLPAARVADFSACSSIGQAWTLNTSPWKTSTMYLSTNLWRRKLPDQTRETLLSSDIHSDDMKDPTATTTRGSRTWLVRFSTRLRRPTEQLAILSRHFDAQMLRVAESRLSNSQPRRTLFFLVQPFVPPCH